MRRQPPAFAPNTASRPAKIPLGIFVLSLLLASGFPVGGARADGAAASETDLRIERPAKLEQVRHALRVEGRRLAPDERREIAEIIVAVAKRNGLSAWTLLALIQQESRFDPKARGPRGALGLMQVRPFVAADVARRHQLPWTGPETLFEPVANVRIGMIYLVEQLERFGTVERALAAYNMGPTRLSRRLAAGRNQRGPYVRKVLSKAEHLAQQTPPSDAPDIRHAAGG